MKSHSIILSHPGNKTAWGRDFLNPIYKFKLGLIFLLFTLNTSCLTKPPRDKKITPYFDLKSYFQKKQNFLIQKSYKIVKTLFYEGRKTTHEDFHPDWTRELYFFKEADLSKPTWQGKYELHYQGTNLQYSLLDSDHLSIREVLFYNWSARSSQFDSVRIIKKQNSLLSKVYSVLVFKPDSSYSIDYYQDIRFYKKTHFRIEVALKP